MARLDVIIKYGTVPTKNEERSKKISRGNRSQYHILQGICDPGKLKIIYFHGAFRENPIFSVFGTVQQ